MREQIFNLFTSSKDLTLTQIILNIAVATNSIPNTGITLPFISYGGTSIVFLLGEMGLALNVSRQKNNPPTR